ncbi:MAG: type 1 glutamine amidotransferase domain-containing protein [Planctomycetota bacterium]
MAPTLPLTNKRVLIFLGKDYEDLELQYPKLRLREAGAHVTLAAPETGVTYPGKHGYPDTADQTLADTNPDDFDALVIPGGWMPDLLRRSDHVKSITKTIADAKKPIASICHGPWIDISAGIVRGVTYTSTPGIKDDLTNAGATWVNAEVHVDHDHQRVSSRRPSDLPAFCRAFIELIAPSGQA